GDTPPILNLAVFTSISQCLARRSELLRASQLRQLLVERAERQVTRFAGHFHDQTVGEPELRSGSKSFECRADDLGALDRQVLVVEQHVDRDRDLSWFEPVDAIEDP